MSSNQKGPQSNPLKRPRDDGQQVLEEAKKRALELKEKKLLEAKQRAAAIAARHSQPTKAPNQALSAGKNGSNSVMPASVQTATTTTKPKMDMEALKARISATTAARRPPPQPSDAAKPKEIETAKPFASQPSGPSDEDAKKARMAALKAKISSTIQKPLATPARNQPELPAERGRGLNIGIHPLLAANVGPGSLTGESKNKGEDEGKGKSRLWPAGTPVDQNNQRDQREKPNPYFDPTATTVGRQRERTRQFNFNEKGKYVELGNEIRRKEQLEEMKKKIATTTAKIADDGEKVFLLVDIPSYEWWDGGLLLDANVADPYGAANINLANGTMINDLVQHPVQIRPPQEELVIDVKPFYQTTKEIKKIRRQRRKVDLQEKQAKIRLGLMEPDAPKVKKSNLMRVLGEQAVKDPTAVEQRVNREIASRREKHEQDNEDRKLTKEQRAEKLKKNQEKDAAKGLFICAWKNDSIANGQHRYKLNTNAMQLGNITGLILSTRSFTLVIAEGGETSLRKYKKLVERRIKWNENAEPKSNDDADEDHELVTWINPKDEVGNLKDLSSNKCQCVFEGKVKDRRFKRWIGLKTVETDQEARLALERAKMDQFWTRAKGMP